jgi:lipoprotein-anchoring transpeptidase ErfK/SrfK
MAGNVARIGLRTGAKLLGGAALCAIAVQVTGLPSRGPATATAPKPAQVAVAAPAKVVPASTPAVEPAAVKVPTAGDPRFEVKRILDVPGPIRIGDWYWDDAGVPAGEVVITADLEAGTLSIFRAGYEIGTAAIIYGLDNMPTPTGLFPITQKDRDHVSNLYDAPMPYMLRLTNDGVSIHGSSVRDGAATHGCIGVPMPFAAKLFAQAKLGTPVLVTDGGLREGLGSVPSA